MRWELIRFYFDDPFSPGSWSEGLEGYWLEKPSKEEILSRLPECFQTEEEISRLPTNGRTSNIDGEYYELYGFITWDEQGS